MIRKHVKLPGELGDPEEVERLEEVDPDGVLRRRDFLGRTATLAGLAGMATVLPTDVLVSEAARVQVRANPLPSPRNMPVDTFVVLMMENRSFDHYLGWLPGADGKNTGLSYPDRDGKLLATHHLPPDWQGCGHPDPEHGWDGGRWQLNGGRNDRFVTGNEKLDGSDEFAIGYYLKDDLPFTGPAASSFQTYDRFFCSIMASTYPNRHYMWAAQGGGFKNNNVPAGTLGHPWETIFDRANGKGVTATYHSSDLPFSALYGTRGLSWTRPTQAEYYTRCATGTLPPITYVDPPFLDGGGGDGVSADDHPHGDIRLGQAFISDVIGAFMESPQWKRGALFLVYDEWGGFFDHVPPPRVPDQREDARNSGEDWGQMGFRIPAVVFSPYVKRGAVSHATCGFESILKMISYRHDLGFLNKRHRYAFNIGRTFDWENPDFSVPKLPDPEGAATAPCRLGGSSSNPLQDLAGRSEPRSLRDLAEEVSAPSRPKPHDLVELVTSGYLDKLGYQAPAATYESTYREPDRVRKAFEGR